MQFATLRDGLQVDVTGELATESEVPDVDVRIDDRRVGSAGAFKNKIGASRNGETTGINRLDVREVEIIASKANVEAGIELLNGFTVRGGIGEMDTSLAMRIGDGASSLHEKIGPTCDGIVISGKRLDRREVSVKQVSAESEIAVTGEMALLKSGGGVKFGGGIVTTQNGAAQGDGMEGKLNRSRERIPVRLEFTRFGGGGQVHVEVVGLQSAGKLRRR